MPKNLFLKLDEEDILCDVENIKLQNKIYPTNTLQTTKKIENAKGK
ncbi:hypothetical protein SDC9_201028 [bioreactor metagenome]|uniref:Uncharacterized protein n=1 Tax=bioreactor metagenome TaxID=1076179 RepID=A0A645IYL1_9ZZZZ